MTDAGRGGVDEAHEVVEVELSSGGPGGFSVGLVTDGDRDGCLLAGRIGRYRLDACSPPAGIGRAEKRGREYEITSGGGRVGQPCAYERDQGQVLLRGRLPQGSLEARPRLLLFSERPLDSGWWRLRESRAVLPATGGWIWP